MRRKAPFIQKCVTAAGERRWGRGSRPRPRRGPLPSAGGPPLGQRAPEGPKGTEKLRGEGRGGKRESQVKYASQLGGP